MNVMRGSAVLLALVLCGVARAEDPPLAPGRDPGGTAVAVLAAGFDYTRPTLAAVLARDGEGEAIAYDAVDGDPRPFDRDGSGTDVALAAAALGGVRLVPVRVAVDDPASLARGVTFAKQTPARIVFSALEGAGGLDVLTAAAGRFGEMLFIVSMPPTHDNSRPRADVPNLIVLAATENQSLAGEAMARVLGCRAGDVGGADGAARKRTFLDRLERAPVSSCDPKGGAKDEKR